MSSNDLDWYLISQLSESNATLETIKIILNLGASVDAVNNVNEETALMLSIRKGHKKIANYFVDRINYLDVQNKEGKTALTYAAQHNFYYVINILINRGADVSLKDMENKLAYDYAIIPRIKKLFEDEKKKRLEEISIPEEKNILYDEVLLKKEIENEESDRREKHLKLLEKTGHTRDLVKLKDNVISEIESLELKFPNFSKAIEFFVKQLHLCNLTEERAVDIKPLLMVGAAGIGKTQFCREIAEVLNLSLNIIQCNTITAGFVLGGGTSQWSGSRPGKVHLILRESREANPFIVLDEIDKMSGDSHYDCYGSLYSLLEKNTAKVFVDELIELPMDHSHINWIATANDINSIPIPIRSRFSILEMREPTKNELKIITTSIYRNILKENKWGKHFSSQLDDDLRLSLLDISPRQIQSVLIGACGKAAMERDCEQYELRVDDIDLTLTDKKPMIGFTN